MSEHPPCPTCGGACRSHVVVHLAWSPLVALLGSSRMTNFRGAWCGAKVRPLELASESLIDTVTCRECLTALADHHRQLVAIAALRVAALDAHACGVVE
jgi:hypothetical protein